MNKILRTTLVFVFGFFTACSSGSTKDAITPDIGLNIPSTSLVDANTKLNFTLDIFVADKNNLPAQISVNTPLSLPLKVETSGALQVAAVDVPTFFYRVCATGSTRTDCDGHTDVTGGLDVDLVIDSCGRLVADANCDDDTTIFNGSLDNSGQITLNDISLRVRAFAITNDSDGHTATTADEGLVNLNRIVSDASTQNITAFDTTYSGSALSGSKVTLVSSGIIATSSGSLAGTDFVAVMTGEFTVDPMTLILN